MNLIKQSAVLRDYLKRNKSRKVRKSPHDIIYSAYHEMVNVFNTEKIRMNNRRRRFINYEKGDMQRIAISGKLKTGIPPDKAERSPFVSPLLEEPGLWRAIPWKKAMIEKIFAYNHRKQPFGNVFERRAKELVEEELQTVLGDDRLHPLGVNAAFKRIPRKTSPGWPISKLVPGLKKRDCLFMRREVRRVLKEVRVKKTSKPKLPPCTAGARRQLHAKVDSDGNKKNKPRLTWVYPLVVTWLEYMFAAPLKDFLEKTRLFAWDINWSRGGYKNVYEQLSATEGSAGVDISGFDANTSERNIRWAFGVLKRMFDPKVFEESGMDKLWKALVEYFIHTPLLGYSYLYQKATGIPSGSTFTQIIGTLINAKVSTHAYLHTLSSACPPGCTPEQGIRAKVWITGLREFREIYGLTRVFSYFKFLGDDSLLGTKFSLGKRMMAMYCERLEWLESYTASIDKCWYLTQPLNHEVGLEHRACKSKQRPDFLGKIFSDEQTVKIRTERLLAQMMYPEFPDEGPGDLQCRLICLAWSTGNDPKQYRMIEEEFNRSVKMYGNKANQGEVKRDMEDIFMYVLHEPPPEEMIFPSFDEIDRRYRGLDPG